MGKKKNENVLSESLVDLLNSGDIEILKSGMFCPNCHTILNRRKMKGVEETLMYCKRCDQLYYKLPSEDNIIVSALKENNIGEGVVMQTQAHTVKRECPYCGNPRMFEIQIPPRWGDEDDLIIYKCPKCGKSERQGYSY